MNSKRLGIILFLIFLPFSSAHAALDLVLTQGINGAAPIAIVPFANDSTNITQVITNDLKDSGRFIPLDISKMPAQPHDDASVNYSQWQALKQNNLVVGSITPVSGGKYKINFELLNVFNGNPPMLSQQLVVPANQLRQAAHRISDIIFQQLTGERGIFSTRIAYVLVENPDSQNKRYLLEVADADGYNPRAVLTSPQPIMSPAWSHDGRKLAYVSFQAGRPQIYISNLATGAQTLVSSYPGVNGAPAFSPDDSQIAFALSKGVNTKIFVMNLNSHQTQQVTNGDSIDTEPNWSPDGKSLLFTSDRGGSPQIYLVNIASGSVQRMSYNGDYNARASFSPDGQKIVMMHRVDGNYGIGLQDLQSSAYLVLDSGWNDQSPSFAPNGEMVLYAGNENGRGVLNIVSTDDRIKLRLPSDQGDVQEPAWSPFLN